LANVFYRNPGLDYPRAVRGEGVYLFDEDGNRYLDGSGGAAISCLGHGHPTVSDAIHRQVDEMAFAHTLFFTNEPQERLAGRLADRFPEPGARVYFVSGGSEANETAIKLARQYWLSRGRQDKHIVISRRQSYHGNTLGALSVTGHRKRRAPYEPLLQDWPRADPCYSYRYQRVEETAEEYAIRCADSLDRAISETGAERVSAFIAETVVGASLGAVPAEAGYFERVREICDHHDVLLILDEVMAGTGRTGTFFAFEQEGVLPDIVTLAKGLGGGYQPIGAVLAKGDVYDAIAGSGSGFAHGHTYVGHATACAAGLAVMDVLENDGLLGRVSEMGQRFDQLLRDTFLDHPHVGDIRGRGLFRGLELVADRASRRPVSGELNLPPVLRRAAMDQGLVCYPSGCTADGVDGAHILLAPPFIINANQLQELCQKLYKAMEGIEYV
jgi:adenosylmethionine-8-amino-7-oxononanoate aminotransferase